MSNDELSESYDIVYMYSWPPTNTLQQVRRPTEALDFEGEQALLVNAFNACNKKVKFRVECATLGNLRHIVTLGCRALHYAGHGQVNGLVLENDDGDAYLMDPQNLQTLLSAGTGARHAKFVFLSACHTERAAFAFVQAGVPHVVAIRHDSQIADATVKKFTNQLYVSLLAGHTVRHAFDTAVTTIGIDRVANTREDKKFLLLPENGNHDEAIFRNIENGPWQQCSLQQPPTNLPAEAECFSSRNLELFECITSCKKRRLVNIYGSYGVGKSALAIATGRYMWQRRMWPDGVFFVRLGDHNPFTPQADGALPAECRQLILKPRCTSINQVICKELGLDEKTDTIQYFANKRILLILDDVDDYTYQHDPFLNIEIFVSKLLTKCNLLRVLVTSEHEISVNEHAVAPCAIKSLSPVDSAKLFYRLSPRVLQISEFKCGDSERAQAAQVLARHPVLTSLEGLPRRIVKAVRHLANKSLDDITDIVMQNVTEEKKTRQLIESRRKAQVEVDDYPIKPRPHIPISSTSVPMLSPHHHSNSSNNNSNMMMPPHILSTVSLPIISPPPTPSDVSPPEQTELVRENTRNYYLENHKSWDVFRNIIQNEQGCQFWATFGHREYVAWSEFERQLSQYFLHVTKAYDRPLEPKDLTSIGKMLSRLANNDQITVQNFARFWPFFNHVTSCIQRNLSIWSMSNPRVIYGFISRDEAIDMLRGLPAGTFLFRFSERYPGNIALSYVDANEHDTVHILVQVTINGYSIQVEKTLHFFPTLQQLVLALRPLVSLYPGKPKEECFRDGSDEPA